MNSERNQAIHGGAILLLGCGALSALVVVGLLVLVLKLIGK